MHAIALQIPISELKAKNDTIGVWASTERPNVTVDGKLRRGWTQVSRLGNPLVNEVVVPTPFKDAWNRSQPVNDKQYAGPVVTPILAKLMNDLYKLNAPEDNRDDLVAVFGTGVKGLNFTGHTVADMLRLNYSIPVTPPGKVSRLGVIGGDNGGFPNGRRLGDDVIDIAEQVMAGFLKGNKVPLGDGVNARRRPGRSTRSRTRPTRRRGSPTRRASRSPDRSGRERVARPPDTASQSSRLAEPAAEPDQGSGTIERSRG